MQVAVRLRRETGMHDIDLALGEVGIDNIRQKVGKFFVCHDYTPKLVSVTLLQGPMPASTRCKAIGTLALIILHYYT